MQFFLDEKRIKTILRIFISKYKFPYDVQQLKNICINKRLKLFNVVKKGKLY